MDIPRYKTPKLSLELWQRILTRIRDDIALEKNRFHAQLVPLEANVDMGSAALESVATRRHEAMTAVRRIEGLQLLLLELELQVKQATFTSGIDELVCRVAGMREIESFYLEHFRDRAHRVPEERRMQDALDRFNSLRNAGYGEQTTAERQLLRSMTFKLQVLGTEEAEQIQPEARDVRSLCDELDAERLTRLLTTHLALDVNAERAALLGAYGVVPLPVEPTPAQAAPAQPELTAAPVAP